MRNLIPALVASTAVSLLGFSNAATADPVSWQFTFRASLVHGPLQDVLGVTVVPGTILNGSVTFEPGPQGDLIEGEPFGIRVDLGGGLIEIDSVGVFMPSVRPGVTNELGFRSEGIVNGHQLVMGLSLFDVTETVFTPGEVPHDPPPLAALSQTSFNLQTGDPGEPGPDEDDPPTADFAGVGGALVSLETVADPVPEPATLSLLGIGLGTMLFGARRNNTCE